MNTRIEKCNVCEGKGTYIGVMPPGKDVELNCYLGCKVKVRKPRTLNDEWFLNETTGTVSNWPQGHKTYIVYELKSLKRIHAWLGKAIQYLEQKK